MRTILEPTATTDSNGIEEAATRTSVAAGDHENDRHAAAEDEQ